MEERLRRLEIANRRLTAGIVVLGLALFVGLAAGAARAPAVADKIRARSIAIVDEDGKNRIELGSDELGPSIAILNSDEHPQFQVLANQRGATLYFEDTVAGKARMTLAYKDGGDPAIIMWDNRNKIRFGAHLVGDDHHPDMRMMDAKGVPIWVAP